jgi:hypothetical protein
MNTLAADFRDVFKLYLRLSQDLTQIMDVDDSEDPQALVQSILKNRECLARIEQMNSRVLQLTGSWENCRDDLDAASANEVRELAHAVKSQAIHLNTLCSIQAQKVQMTRDTLCSKIAELSKATQHLKSLKPVKNNYPKFIDYRY